MNIGCLFGTFDPPHKGHTAIAAWMLENVPFDEVWLVVTPRNPFKQHRPVSADHHRLAMTRLAVTGMHGVSVCEEELRLTPPNYTVDSLAHFRERWPQHMFSLIIGSDNLASFDHWKDHDGILRHHPVVVYPRPGEKAGNGHATLEHDPRIRITNAPMMGISSTRVRKTLQGGGDAVEWLAPTVASYIRQNGLYAS